VPKREKLKSSVLAARIADVRQHEVALLRTIDADHVHDMRVATRRLRAALQLLVHDERARRTIANVKRLQDALGVVRDRHVQLQWLSERTRARKPFAAAVRKRLRTALTRDRAALSRALAAWVRRAPAIERMAAVLKSRGKLGGHRVRHELRRRLRALDKAVRKLAHDLPAQAAHRLRIDAKRLRYLGELVAPALPHVAAPLVKHGKRLQSLLGEVHDADVRLQLLAPRARALTELAQAERDHAAKKARQEIARWRKQRIAKKLRRALR
jgi:CHAD domain-containing protein